jgi:hypothetical protein
MACEGFTLGERAEGSTIEWATPLVCDEEDEDDDDDEEEEEEEEEEGMEGEGGALSSLRSMLVNSEWALLCFWKRLLWLSERMEDVVMEDVNDLEGFMMTGGTTGASLVSV